MRQLIVWFAAKILLDAAKILLDVMKRRMVRGDLRLLDTLKNKGVHGKIPYASVI
jgi:hypothetical protein